jgi:hypothetical protein
MAVENEPIGDGDAKEEERWRAEEVPLCWRCGAGEGKGRDHMDGFMNEVE